MHTKDVGMCEEVNLQLRGQRQQTLKLSKPPHRNGPAPLAAMLDEAEHCFFAQLAMARGAGTSNLCNIHFFLITTSKTLRI